MGWLHFLAVVDTWMDEFFGMLLLAVVETAGFGIDLMFDEDLYVSLFQPAVARFGSALISLNSFYQQKHIEADAVVNVS